MLLGALARAAWPGRPPEQPERVCLWRTGNVGDLVCALPVLAAARVRWPEAQLTLLTSPGARGAPGARELLADATWIDDLSVYHPDEVSWRAFARELRDRRFDVVLRFPQNRTSARRELRDLAFLRSAVRPGWARGFAVGGLTWISRGLGARYAHGRTLEHESRRLLDLHEEAGGPVRRPEFPLPIGGAVAERAEHLFAEHGLGRGPLLCIAPGAKRATNRWPAERFGAVARSWLANGDPVVLLGGAGDRPLAERVLEVAGEGLVDLCGESPLTLSAAILARASVCVANDSGCMHLAAAVGTPCVIPFSARDATGRWHPFEPDGETTRHAVIRRSPPCSPCWLETCPHDNACLIDIETEEVLRSAREHARRLSSPAVAI